MPRSHGKIEKSKDFKGSIQKIFKSLSPWHFLLVISLTLAMVSAILALVAPNQLSNLTDYITEGITPRVSEKRITKIMQDSSISLEDKQKAMEIIGEVNQDSKTEELLGKLDQLPKSIKTQIEPVMNMSHIKRISLVLAIIYVVSSLFSYVEQIIMANVSNGYSKMLRGDITNKINRLPLKYFDSHETGDVLSRITNDVDTIAQNMNQSLATLVTSVTLFIGSVIMMFVTNWIMAITGIVASIIGFLFMFMILAKSQKYFVQRQERLGDLNGYIEEIYSGHNVVVK